MPPPRQLWSPKILLSINPSQPNFTCIGHSYRNRNRKRCYNLISSSDRESAFRVLDQIAQLPVASPAIEILLREVAMLTHCRRNHRDDGLQVDSKVREWMALVEGSRNGAELQVGGQQQAPVPIPVRVEDREVQELQVAAAVPQVVGIGDVAPAVGRQILRLERVTPSPQNLTIHPQAQAPAPVIPQPQRIINRNQILQPQVAELPEARVATPRVQQQPAVMQPLAQAQALSLGLNPIPRALISRRGSNATVAQSQVLQPQIHHQAQLTPLFPRLNPFRPQRPQRLHVPRKPLTEACPICYEPIEQLDDAEWCRGTCGQNIHRSCWSEWLDTKFGEGIHASQEYILAREGVECCFCRGGWVWE